MKGFERPLKSEGNLSIIRRILGLLKKRENVLVNDDFFHILKTVQLKRMQTSKLGV